MSNNMLVRWGTVLMALSSVTAFAHHSYTRFDMKKTLTLEGTVKDFQWTNPHIWIQLLVRDSTTGKDVEWSLESDSPIMLKRKGWTRKSLEVGDKAVAVIHPPKIGTDLSGALESVSVNGRLVGP